MADTKNPGPLLKSWTQGNASALPQEWQAKVGVYQEDQEMPLGFMLPSPNGAVVLEQRLIQTRTDERKRTSLMLNAAAGGGDPPPGGGPPGSWQMIEEVRLPQGQVATRTRALIPDDHPADSHLVLTDDMIQAEQKNTGLGVLDQTVLVAPLITAPTLISYRIDNDGDLITIAKTRKKLNTINEGENATAVLWTKIYAEDETATVANEVVETMVLPGHTTRSTKLDADGLPITVTKTKMSVGSVVTNEDVTSGSWTKSYKEAITDSVAYQVTEFRQVPGLQVQEGQISPRQEVVNTYKTIKELGDITVAATATGMTLTMVEKKALSHLVGEELRSVKTVDDESTFTESVDFVIPQQFRPWAIIDEESSVVAGQAQIPILAQDDIERSEQQITALYKRKSSKSFDVALPIVLNERSLTTQYGGVMLNTEKRLDVSNSPGVAISPSDAAELTTIDAKQTRLGRFILREMVTSGAFPLLNGTDIDTELNVALPYTQQVIDAGTAGSVTPSSATEIKPMDAARSLKIVRTIPVAALTAYKLSLPGTTNIDFPSQLMSLTGVITSRASAAGAYAQSGNFTIFNQGSGSIHLRGEAHGSAASMFDVIPVIKQTWGQGIPCTHWLFFIAGPTPTFSTILAKLNSVAGGGILAWPKFKPQSAQFTCKGQKLAGTCDTDIQHVASVECDYSGLIVHASGSTTAGAGASSDTEVIAKSVIIPPTIHGNLSIGGDGVSHSENFSASASLSSGLIAKAAVVYGTAQAAIYPTSVSATPGQTTIPTSGKFCYQMRTEPYKYGFLKCDCTVVNAFDWS